MSSSFDQEEGKIPFDLDECVTVNLFTLKNVLTFIMNKVTKNSKINSELLDSNNELRRKLTEMEKTVLEKTTDMDILKVRLHFSPFRKTLAGSWKTRNSTNLKHSDQLADFQKKVSRIDEVVNDLESKLLLVGGSGDGSTGADMKVFEIMIHKLRKEFKGRFVTAAELDEKHQEYTKEFLRVKELDNEVSNIISRVDLIKKNVDNAVDKKDFRYEIDKLAQNYRSLGAKLRNRSAGEQQDNNADESDVRTFID